LELWNVKRKWWPDWVYIISPEWEEFEVYCDMTTAW